MTRFRFRCSSWHEVAYYDVPALIDHIIDATKFRQVMYIGHSMGSTVFFAMASCRPEYNDKVRAMAALAPVAFMSGPYSPFYKSLAKRGQQFKVSFFLWKEDLNDQIIKYKKMFKTQLDVTSIVK